MYIHILTLKKIIVKRFFEDFWDEIFGTHPKVSFLFKK